MLHTLINARITALVEGGSDRRALVGALADATGSPASAIESFLAGGEGATQCDDLEDVRAMADVLSVPEVDAIQAALGGALMESRLTAYTDLGGGLVDGTGSQVRLASVLGGELQANQNDFISSTGAEARDGEIIDQASWRLGHYRKNPVVLDGHNTDHVIGRTAKVQPEGGMLLSRITWNVANPLGAERAQEHAEGFRQAVSVRWITGKRVARNELPDTDPRYQAKPKRVDTVWGPIERFGNVLFNNTLLEQSSVSVPGDPRALQQRGLGVDAVTVLAGAPDAHAATDARAILISTLADPGLWTDAGVRIALAGALRHAVRSDIELRRLLEAVGLTSPPRELTADQSLILGL